MSELLERDPEVQVIADALDAAPPATVGLCSSRRPPASASRRCSRPRAPARASAASRCSPPAGASSSASSPSASRASCSRARARGRAAERRRLLAGQRGAGRRAARSRAARRRRAAGRGLAVPAPARPALARGEPRRAHAARCSSSTTPTGPTSCRCASSRTSPGASRTCRSRSSPPAARARSAATRRCSRSSPPSPRPGSLRPGPLSEAATGRLVAARAAGAEPPFVAACHRATGGNPFLLVELLTALAQEGVAPVAASVARVREIGPAPVSRAVELALRGLPPEATRRGARAGGPRRRRAGRRSWPRCPRVPVDAAGRAVTALRGARDPRPGRRRVAFAHPILGRAIYEELDAGERAAAHRRRGAGPPRRRRAGRARRRARAQGRRRRRSRGRRRAARGRRRRAAPRRAAAGDALTCAARSRSPTTPASAPRSSPSSGAPRRPRPSPSAADRLREAMATIRGGPERRAGARRRARQPAPCPRRVRRGGRDVRRALAELGPGATPLHLALEAGWAAAALWNRTPAPQIRARVEPLVDARRGAPERRAERDAARRPRRPRDARRRRPRGAIALRARAWGDGALLEQRRRSTARRSGRSPPRSPAARRGTTSARCSTSVAGAARRAGAVLADATAGLRARVPLDVPRRDRRRPRRGRPHARGARASGGAPSCRARSGSACAACCDRGEVRRGRGDSSTCRPPTRRAFAARPLALDAARRPGERAARAQRRARGARDVARGRRARGRDRRPQPRASSRGAPGAALAAARLGEGDEARRARRRGGRGSRGRTALPRTLGSRSRPAASSSARDGAARG